MMRKYDTVAFDLDGTLCDPVSGLTSSFAYALSKMGIDYGDKASLSRFIGPPLIDEFKAVYAMNEEEAIETVRLFREYFSVYGWWDNIMYDGVPEMLSKLKSEGCTVVLATSKPEIFARKIVRLFDIEKYFDFVGAASLDKSRSNKSQVLDYTLRSICVDSRERCILVGDRKYDAEGAQICGIDSLGVLYGHGSKDEILMAGFTDTVKSVGEIADFILKS